MPSDSQTWDDAAEDYGFHSVEEYDEWEREWHPEWCGLADLASDAKPAKS